MIYFLIGIYILGIFVLSLVYNVIEKESVVDSEACFIVLMWPIFLVAVILWLIVAGPFIIIFNLADVLAEKIRG